MRHLIDLIEAALTHRYPLADRNSDGWYSHGTFEATGGRMIHMTPDEYLSRVRPLEIDDVSRENIDDLKRHIEKGGVLDPLAIYADGKEDGRHRAYAAKELGIGTVPVIVWDSAPKAGHTERPDYTRQMTEEENFETNLLFEMAGLRESLTGLPFYVWISSKGGAKHDVRIKCSPTFKYDPEREAMVGLRPDLHIIHGSMDNKSFQLLTKWVNLNIDTILAFWNEEIETDEMRSRIKPI